MTNLTERVAKAMWDSRRAHAAKLGIEMEEWGDGTIPKYNGILEEALAAIEVATAALKDRGAS